MDDNNLVVYMQSLIDPNGRWNEDMVRQLVTPSDAEHIL